MLGRVHSSRRHRVSKIALLEAIELVVRAELFRANWSPFFQRAAARDSSHSTTSDNHIPHILPLPWVSWVEGWKGRSIQYVYII